MNSETFSKYRLVVTLSCALFVSGCAFGTRQAKIVYPPIDQKKTVATNTPAALQGTIAVEQFTDERPDKDLVGHVRNAYGMKTAQVKGPGDLTELLNLAVRIELVNAGYTICDNSESAPTGIPVVGGSLIKLHCDAMLAYEGTASIQMRIIRDGKEVFRRIYEGEGSAGVNFAMSGSSYGKSLSLAIQDALQELTRDLPVALRQ